MQMPFCVPQKAFRVLRLVFTGDSFTRPALENERANRNAQHATRNAKRGTRNPPYRQSGATSRIAARFTVTALAERGSTGRNANLTRPVVVVLNKVAVR